MLALLGVAIVFAAVLGGFLLEKGNLWVLFQPAELLIVGGAAVGIVLVGNPPTIIRKMFDGVVGVFRSPPRTPASYLGYLRMLYEIFSYGRRGGIAVLEEEAEDPMKGKVFSNHPEFLGDVEVRSFVCDSLRILVIGASSPQELDQIMQLDIEVQRRGRHEPVAALSTMADALPGLGIVAAVLGVVVTMGAIGSAPELIGQKVAAALVGTFLGILLCYGVVGPLAAQMENRCESRAQFLEVLRIGLGAYARGVAPILAVEMARRSIPIELRPSFVDMETSVRRDARIPAVTQPGASQPVANHAG